MNLSENSVQSLAQNKEKWYTIEDLAFLCGYSKGNALLANPNTNELLNQFNNSNDVKMGGYHNTQKFYSDNVLKALKQYQLRNSTPNALQNKEVAVSGNVSFVVNETRTQTIAAILNDPKALLELAMQSSQKLLEAQPKIEWYDNVADSSNLTEIGTIGKKTGIGSQKIFKKLREDKIIYQKCDSDGVFYDVPFYDYEKYFEIIPEPFIKGDKKCVRNKLLFNQKGVIWATKRYQIKETK